MAALAGNPQERLRFIHVAGTNGKGSTCAMLETFTAQRPARRAVHIAPSRSFAERIQVNPSGSRIGLREDWRRRCTLAAEFPKEGHPTYSRWSPWMALRWFSEQQCELVVWETGLGGRLDATNIITPLASVITNIGFDHQQWTRRHVDKSRQPKRPHIKPACRHHRATPGRGLEVIAQTGQRAGAPLP